MDYLGAAFKTDTLKISKATCTAVTSTKAMANVTTKIQYKGSLASFSPKDRKDIDGNLIIFNIREK